MDDQELRERLTRIQKGVDEILALDGIYWNKYLNAYEQEGEPDEQADIEEEHNTKIDMYGDLKKENEVIKKKGLKKKVIRE